MSKADWERFQIVATSNFDVGDSKALRRYFKAQYELQRSPTDTDEWISYRVNTHVAAISKDQRLRDAVKTTLSARHLIRARVLLNHLEDKNWLKKALRRQDDINQRYKSELRKTDSH